MSSNNSDSRSTKGGQTDAVSTVAVTIDGREIQARPGELVIAAAQRHGTYIPRFCYHERMSPVGMCRMCLVEIDAGRGPQLQPSCIVTVTDGMSISTQSELALNVQEGVLEHLLINHPLDCPVCDKGGECSLQDQTLAYGPGETRFVEEKRHFPKPIPVSELVDLDRERCILCDRCTRFADEVAGDPLITFTERGNTTQVLTFPDEPFSSYFSGNTVQLCPVGALTATPYRFKARPWDLKEADSTCTTCSVGCAMAIQSSRDQLVRFVGLDVGTAQASPDQASPLSTSPDHPSHGWLCDKGRFAFDLNNSPQRITTPRLRSATAPATSWTETSWTETSWNSALAKVAQALASARPSSVAVIGGAHGTNEDAYAWAKFARTACTDPHLDAQLGDGLPAYLLEQLPLATIDETCEADTVLLLGPDLKEELPVLYLRLRQAAVQAGGTGVVSAAPAGTGGTQLVEIGSVATGLRPYATNVIECLGGETAVALKSVLDPTSPNSANPDLAAPHDPPPPDRIALSERLANGSVVVVLGRSSTAESATSLVEAAQLVRQHLPHAKFLPALRRPNVRGAIAMGLTPAPATKTTAGILQAAAQGDVDVLFLLGADPLADFPDAALAAAALDGAGLVVAVDAFATRSAQAADIFLPAALFGEKAGTTTNLEGRVRLVSKLVNAPGSARPDWVIATELARHCGHDLGFADRSDVTNEIAHTFPSHAALAEASTHQLATHGVLTTPTPQNPNTQNPNTLNNNPQNPNTQNPTFPTPTNEGGVGGHASGPTAVVAAESGATGTSEGGGEAGSLASARDTSATPLTTIATNPNNPTTPTTTAPPRDSYALRLVTTRTLYDASITTTHTPSLAGLTPGPALLLHPVDFSHIGVSPGTEVELRSAHGSISVPAFDTPSVSRGNAVVRLNQPTASPTAASTNPAANQVTSLVSIGDDYCDVVINPNRLQ